MRKTKAKAKRTSHGRTATEEKTARRHEVATKLRGELAELAFALKAVNLGFGVAKPYGDSQRFDFILRSGSKLSRVQVKSTTTLLNGLYRINAHRRIGGRAVAYLPSEVDFLVAYIIPEQVWFILPYPRHPHAHQSAVLPPGLPPRRNQRGLPRSLAPAARDQVIGTHEFQLGRARLRAVPNLSPNCHPELAEAEGRALSAAEGEDTDSLANRHP